MTTPALHARAWPWRALKPRLAVVEVGGRCGRFWKVLSPAWASGEEPRLPSALLIFPFPRAPPPWSCLESALFLSFCRKGGDLTEHRAQSVVALLWQRLPEQSRDARQV